jgi:type II secretory pathway component PulJ
VSLFKRASQAAGFSQDGGFVLLEVMVAMSLVAGTLLASVNIYQSIWMRYQQLHTQKIDLLKQRDGLEIDEHRRNISESVIKHDSSRLPGRSYDLHDASGPHSKNHR